MEILLNRCELEAISPACTTVSSTEYLVQPCKNSALHCIIVKKMVGCKKLTGLNPGHNLADSKRWKQASATAPQL